MKNIYVTLMYVFFGVQILTAQLTIPPTYLYETYKITATKAHLGKYGTVTVTVDRAPYHVKITKPLIVAEGFDVGTLLEPENKFGMFNYSNFREFLKGSGNQLRNLIFENYKQYDIIYVDWDNGVDYLQRNAYAFEEVIRWVNEEKASAGSTEPNVVLGQSMGGVIARYALADMEETYLVHDTRLFVSHDAPQQGANVPVSLQYMYRHLTQQYASAGKTLLGNLVTVPILEHKYGVSNLLSILDQPAPRQLLTNWASYGYKVINTNSESEKFYNELNKKGRPNPDNPNGYPVNCKCVAMSNGAECGQLQYLLPGDDLVNYNYNNGLTFAGDLLSTIWVPLGAYAGGLLVDDKLFGVSASGLLLGSSRFNAEINAKALFDTPGNQIYKGKVWYTKKFLWMIPITTTITDVQKNQPANVLLPMDSYGGGYYDMNNVTGGTSLPEGVMIAPLFNFIPTPSALDIGKRKVVLTDSDYTSSYLGKYPPVAPKNSPFLNFGADYDEIDTSNGNHQHISFDPKHGNWLASELNNNNSINASDCSYFCGDFHYFYISGNSSFCTSASYSVSTSSTSTFAYKWTVENTGNPVPPLVTLSTDNTKNTVLTATGEGSGEVSLTMTLNGCKVFSRNIWVGSPDFSVTKTKFYSGGWYGNGWSEGYNGWNLAIENARGIDYGYSVVWTENYGSGGILHQASDGAASVSGLSGTPWSINITTAVSNVCGTTSKDSSFSSTPPDTRDLTPTMTGKKTATPAETTTPAETIATILLYPNPNDGLFNIDLTNIEELYDTIKVYNMLGEMVYEGSLKSRSSNQINLSGSATGCYIVKISGDNVGKSFQLIKK